MSLNKMCDVPKDFVYICMYMCVSVGRNIIFDKIPLSITMMIFLVVVGSFVKNLSVFLYVN